MTYSIGIDLGTTNCALAFVSLDDPEAGSQVFSIPQCDGPGRTADRNSLPSFLFRPVAAERESFATDSEWIPGNYARQVASERPGAVAHSSKSWLCHHTVDRSQAILPWGSDEVSAKDKISPIQASRLLLEHLRDAWNSAFPGHPFQDQEITVTVPASFDAVAQKLTLRAAAEAGMPDSVRLLEEPQAVFYRWLEAHPGAGALCEKLPDLADRPQHVVVIDIGGGTSDFSLFELQMSAGKDLPDIKRIAVSDHILLGGDNIDLAIAHLVEPRFDSAGERGTLSAKQWNYLVARCRDLKERILGGGAEEEYSLSIPGSGSGLIAGTLSGKVSREEIERLLFTGFFPKSEKNATPQRPRAALRELGLPYAADGAISRHLAGFLNGRPQVDGILFNGGTTAPAKLQERLVEQIAYWQGGVAPAVLDNVEPDLAVARGAAHFGSLPHRKSVSKISAGAARAIYLEVASAGGSSLVCILPRGTQPGQEVVIAKSDLQLQLNRRVEFQTWYSTRHEGDEAGAVIPLDTDTFHSLPPLHTTAELSGQESVPIQLRAQLNTVGLLTIDCQSEDQSWPLEFDLQILQQGDEGKPPPARSVGNLDPGVDSELLTRAHKRITGLLKNPADRRDPVKPTQLIKSLEKILGQPKHEWNGALVRGLWPALEECFDARALSVEHEECWLNIAGFLLRPGCGAPGDDARIDSLWRLHESGPAFPKKNIRVQLYVLWRRVVGGLDRDRQTALIGPELPRLRESKKVPGELVRLAGSLERLDGELKQEFAELFIARGSDLVRDGKHAADYFASLTNLLTRIPLYAGPENMLPAALVETLFDLVKHGDWSGPNGIELTRLFLRAARLTGDRQLDVSGSLRRHIQSKLEKAGIAPTKLQPLRQVIPLSDSDRVQSFGEALPAGLSLGA